MTTEEDETTSEASSTMEDAETTTEDTTTTASPPLSDLTPAGNTFLHEWTKLRYGVFEQYGFPGDARYPAFYEDSEGEFSPNHCTNVEIEGAEMDIVSGSSNCQGPDSREVFGLKEVRGGSIPNVAALTFHLLCTNQRSKVTS